MADPYLQDLFSHLADEDIIARITSGLTPDAYAIACRELQHRGIAPPPLAQEPPAPAEPPYLGDEVILARHLDPAEAQIIVARLAAAGIAASVGDIDTARVYVSTAIGGAKIRVPQSQLAQAQQMLDAFNRGEFALDDDFDVGREME